jgi:hypothetical protein
MCGIGSSAQVTSWLFTLIPHTFMAFSLDCAGLSAEGLQQLHTEQQQHGDILLLDIIDPNDPDPPLNDSDKTATFLKVVYSVKWAVQHYTFPWLVRLADDSYFRVDHFLLNVASSLQKDKLVLGYRCE